MTLPLPKPKPQSLFAVFFWLFNLSLLLILAVTVVAPFGRAIINDALRGVVPLSLLVPLFGLVGVPTTSTVISRWRKRQLNALNVAQSDGTADVVPQRQSVTLVQIFFGLEAPLLMACTIRLFFFRDLTPISTVIFVSMALGTVAFGHWLMGRQRPESAPTSWAHLAGITLMLGLSLYLWAIALFYALPIITFIGVILFNSIYMLAALPILFPFIMLFTGLVIMPWGMVLLFYRAWRTVLRSLALHRDRWIRALGGGTVALWLGALLILQQQPQVKAFDLLASPPQSASERQALLQKAEVIRRGLLNAYLGSYRYPLLNNTDLYYLYSDYLKFPEAAAEAIQGAYNALLSPFAYQGTAADKGKAAQLYAEFFDTPILRGEHEAIQTAVLSNINRTQAKAGLLDIGAERVRLQRQEITVAPEGDWAEVELHEIYANTTVENTEVLYYFSLPESATITGLWLGETGDRAQRYNHVVATRGAAQQVYNDQVQRSVDPALLEQVGPRNYRLRAFPIPPMGQDRLPEDGNDDTMHLWMTYKVMQQDGQWPMPVLSEQRNIFWNQTTERLVNGVVQPGSEAWLPASLSAAGSGNRRPVQVALPSGYIVAQPLETKDYDRPDGKRFAVVLDGSYSMGQHRKAVDASIQWLKDNLLTSNAADVYVTSAGATQAEMFDGLEFDPKQTTFYGAMQPRQMLDQYQQAIAAAGTPGYDAIILLTDAGSYELTEDSTPLSLTAPLWLVHLGGFQAAYDDATLETIQRTGGNTAADLATAMTRIATQPSLGEGTSLLNVVDGYAWFLSGESYPGATTAATMAPLAARQWVAQVSQAVKPDQLNQLDAIHQVAKDNSIVTPYSSMLVLVNSEQQRQLEAAEAKSDRFDREVEDQQLPDPQNVTVSAVPEPGEWLLLAVCFVMLGLWYWQKASLGARLTFDQATVREQI